jgi:hypothetical protein
MTTDRQKPSVAFWASVALVVLLVRYPLSFGPACWWFTRTTHDSGFGMTCTQHYAPRFYWPIGWLATHGPTPVANAFNWYGTRRYNWVRVPTGRTDQECTDLIWPGVAR